VTSSEPPGEQPLHAIGFRGVRGGGASARFAPAEAMLLRGLVTQVADLIGEGLPAATAPGEDGGQAAEDPAGAAVTDAALEHMLRLSDSTQLPDDPILARLLPDAYPDDEDASGEFRRYTEHSVRSGKLAAAQTVLGTLPESGGRIRLSRDDAQAWLRALNDIRLALGVQLNVTEDMADMIDQAEPGTPQAAGLWIYDWLSLLQQTLVHALW
jgi:hypothetical protein